MPDAVRRLGTAFSDEPADVGDQVVAGVGRHAVRFEDRL
jgi:hypothetical protein